MIDQKAYDIIKRTADIRDKLLSMQAWYDIPDDGREAVNEVVNEARDYIDQSTLDSKVTAARGVA